MFHGVGVPLQHRRDISVYLLVLTDSGLYPWVVSSGLEQANAELCARLSRGVEDSAIVLAGGTKSELAASEARGEVRRLTEHNQRLQCTVSVLHVCHASHCFGFRALGFRDLGF
jgi:hypothetical protein